MKNGSLPQRILRKITGQRLVRRADLAHHELGDYDQVGRALRRLEREGHLEKIGRGTWLHLSKKMPPLMHARAWSRPAGVSDEVLLRATLSRPSYDDLAALCLAFGLKRIAETLDDLRRHDEVSERVAERDAEILANVQAGLLRKGRALHDQASHR